MNSVALVGRLVHDPEVRYTADQMAVCRMRLAVDRQGKDKETDFISCIAFGKTAEFVEKYFAKGKPIGIVGRIQTGSYEKKDGSKVYTTDIIADRVEFVGSRDEEKQEKKVSETDMYGFIRDDEDVPF